MIRCRERAAERRRRAHDREERISHGPRLELSRFAHAGQGRREVDRRHGGDRRERRRAGRPVARVAIGNFDERMVAGDVGLPQHRQTPLIPEGIRADQNRIDHAPERSGRTDANRQCRDDDAERRPAKGQPHHGFVRAVFSSTS
jgi:hypothetical protein